MNMRKCFDILKGDDQSIIHPYDFIFSSAFVAVEKDDDFPIIAATAAAVLSSWKLHGNAAFELELTCQVID
jgi:hypothetical protein